MKCRKIINILSFMYILNSLRKNNRFGLQNVHVLRNSISYKPAGANLPVRLLQLFEV